MMNLYIKVSSHKRVELDKVCHVFYVLNICKICVNGGHCAVVLLRQPWSLGYPFSLKLCICIGSLVS